MCSSVFVARYSASEPILAPPQTNSVWPVMKLLSGARKNCTARATSAGLPSRFTGIELATWSIFSLPSGITSWNISVSAMGPGATTLTVMPSAASSSAQVRAMPTMPDLVAE